MKDYKIPNIIDIFLTLFASILCGMGCGFVNFASLGMDAIGIFYDGIRNVLKLSPEQIGTASYVVCFILSVFLLIVARKYVSIGSVIYILMYGFFANVGTVMWEHLISGDNLIIRILVAILGFLILYIGLGIFIAVDIGVDAFTGVMLWICDITKKDMKIVKPVCDIGLTIIGAVLGGTLGAFTFISIILGGICLSAITKQFQKFYIKNIVIKRYNKGQNPEQTLKSDDED